MNNPGFLSATGSKALVWTTAICSSSTMYMHYDARWLMMGAASPYRFPSMSKIVTSQVAFRDPLEFALGITLLYSLRHVERLVGTRKFTSFILASTALSTILQLAVFTTGVGIVPSVGPFAPIFSLLVFYYAHVPALRILGQGNDVPTLFLSHKTPVYVTAMWLACWHGRNSLLPACMGFLAGAIVKANLVHVLLPSALSRWFKINIDPYFRSEQWPRNPMGRGGVAGAGAGARRDFDGPLHGQAETLIPTLFGGPPPLAAANLVVPEPIQPRAPPSEEDIQTLVGLGVSRDEAIEALERTDGNVNAAANQLFNQ